MLTEEEKKVLQDLYFSGAGISGLTLTPEQESYYYELVLRY